MYNNNSAIECGKKDDSNIFIITLEKNTCFVFFICNIDMFYHCSINFTLFIKILESKRIL